MTGIGNDHLRRLATYASLTVAITLILMKFVAYLMTDSVAVLSSLLDSTVDLLASGVTMLGVLSALRPPDRHHRFGYGKAEPLAALAQAAFIVGSSVLLGYEALTRFIHPQPVQDVAVGYGVMGVTLVLTLGLVSFQKYVVRRTGSMAISADSLHYRGDILLNLAVIGGLWLGQWTGSGFFDPLFALIVVGILLVGARGIARTALYVLLDRELPEEDRARVIQIARAHASVHDVHDLRTRTDGDRQFIDMHLELDSQMTLAAAHDIAHEIEDELRAAFPKAEILIHQEPAGLDDDRLDHRLT